MEKRIIVITGASGAGKTTLANLLLSSGLPLLEKVITATTRDQRNGEKDCRDYFFFSIEEFKLKIKEKFFIEYEEVYENTFYGTPKFEFKRIWDNGNVPVCVVDVWGAQTIAAMYERNVFVVNVAYPNNEIIEERIKSRKGVTSVEERIAKVKKEESLGLVIKSVTIVNDNLEDSAREIVRTVGNFLNQLENSI